MQSIVRYSALRSVLPADPATLFQYTDAVRDTMQRRVTSQPGPIGVFDAYGMMLPFLQFLRDRSLDPQAEHFQLLLRVIGDDFSLDFTSGVGGLLAAGDPFKIANMEELKTEFYWAIHRNFAETGPRSILGRLMGRFEQPEEFIPRRLFFLRPLFYMLVRIYFSDDARLTGLSEVLLDRSLRWDQVPYTDTDPIKRLHEVNENILNVENPYYAYAIGVISVKLSTLKPKHTSLFPREALRKIAQFLPALPSRARSEDLKQLVQIAVRFSEPSDETEKISASSQETVRRVLDENMKRTDVEIFEFNPYYVMGVRAEVEKVKTLFTNSVPMITEMERLFGPIGFRGDATHERVLEKEIEALDLRPRFRTGTEFAWATVHASYKPEATFQPDLKNWKHQAFLGNSSDLQGIISSHEASVLLLRAVIAEKFVDTMEGELKIIFSLSKADVLTQVNQLGDQPLPSALFVVLLLPTTTVRPAPYIALANINAYIITRRGNGGRYQIQLINYEGTHAFPAHLEETTAALKRKFNVPSGEVDARYFKGLIGRNFWVQQDKGLLYLVWYAENVLRGLNPSHISVLPDLFGEHYSEWLESFYFAQLLGIVEKLLPTQFLSDVSES